jgi:hypothetical protein
MTPEKDRRAVPMDKEDYKAAVKEGLKEWLNEQFAAFGKWSLHGLLAMALAGCVYLFMISNGWHK